MKNISFIRGEAQVTRMYNFPIIFDFERKDGNKVEAEFNVSVTCNDGFHYEVHDVSLVESTHKLTDKEYDKLDYEIHDILYSILK